MTEAILNVGDDWLRASLAGDGFVEIERKEYKNRVLTAGRNRLLVKANATTLTSAVSNFTFTGVMACSMLFTYKLVRLPQPSKNFLESNLK